MPACPPLCGECVEKKTYAKQGTYTIKMEVKDAVLEVEVMDASGTAPRHLRRDELDRTIHILARRRKNNPLFAGESGVGKTAHRH